MDLLRSFRRPDGSPTDYPEPGCRWETDRSRRFRWRQYRNGQPTPYVADGQEPAHWDLRRWALPTSGAPQPPRVVLRMQDRDIVTDSRTGTVRFHWHDESRSVSFKLSRLEYLRFDVGQHGRARFEARANAAHGSGYGGPADEATLVMMIAEEDLEPARAMWDYVARLQGLSRGNPAPWGPQRPRLAIEAAPAALPPPVRDHGDQFTPHGQERDPGQGTVSADRHPSSQTAAPAAPPTTPWPSESRRAEPAPGPRPTMSPPLRVAVRQAPADDDWLGFALLPDTALLLDDDARVFRQDADSNHRQPPGDSFSGGSFGGTSTEIVDHWQSPHG